MFRRGLAYFVLAFSLLFAQQGGFAHELGHFSGSSQQSEKQLPHSKSCDQCGAYAQVGSGAVSQSIPFALPESAGAVYSFHDVASTARHFSRHRSRAPPFLA